MVRCLCVFLAVIFSLNGSISTSVSNSGDFSGDDEPPTSLRTKTQIHYLLLVPFPDVRNRSHAGWSAGRDLLTGARVAVSEINQRADILNNYEINLIEAAHESCGLSETDVGLLNLVNNSINPLLPHDVVAVFGLYCSTSTIALSPIAGSEGVDLIQLSASNSPTFKLKGDSFPRLWRFLISAGVYADMMIELMNIFRWENVSLVQDLESEFYTGIAKVFLEAIDDRADKRILYHAGVFKQTESFYERALNDIQNNGARIVFILANGGQIGKLICMAAERDMIYPNYMWIIIDHIFSTIFTVTDCPTDDLLIALNGSILSYFRLGSENSTVLDTTNETRALYLERYDKELKKVRVDYNDDSLTGDTLYSSLAYDQVWAFSMALHNAIKLENISIEDYGFGQPNITEIIEQQLKTISFKGASGYIDFSDDREVSTPIILYQVNSSSTLNPAGDCKVGNDGVFFCDNITVTGVIDDELSSIPTFFPLELTIVIIILIIIVVSLTTGTLACTMYYRNRPEVKATSPFISLIMFGGCYCICFACSLRTINSSFQINENSFVGLCNLELLFWTNGMSFIFTTLFIKLLRISRIFNNKKLVNLSWAYQNYSLVSIVLVMCSIPNIILIVNFAYDPLEHSTSEQYIRDGEPHYEIQHICVSSKVPFVWYGLLFGYLSVVLFCIMYFAVSTRKIQLSNFKDTKKVNVFIVFTIILFTVPTPFYVILISIDLIVLGNSMFIFTLLLLVCSSQVLLFLPKVWPLLFSNTRFSKQKRYSLTQGVLKSTLFFV